MSTIYAAAAYGGHKWVTPKDPAEEAPYAFDFGKELTELGTTITGTPVFTEATAGVSLASASEASGVASVVVSGGTADRDYVIKCVATLVTGAVLVRRGVLSVRTR